MSFLTEMTIETEILEEGRGDWVSFAFINQCVGVYEGFEQGEPARSRRSVEVAAHLVASGRLVAGDLTTSGFLRWEGAGGELALRVRRTADEVIREHGYIPLGEVCWFAAPELLDRLDA
ncbi:hypothetical protein PHK61_13105 [Actinomycetospora lutea]|uniref:hypothetical protein n=1 Tax=Actinomycetospora lutea TaxID=663604 RepID=UPI0023669279|nr:hypothetical protein [Actinomycetospora lutea]MDD7939356.1 hypothetical protein [Actinomycetospora lutea]